LEQRGSGEGEGGGRGGGGGAEIGLKGWNNLFYLRYSA